MGRLSPVLLLFAAVAGFYWKILFTRQYTWLDQPDLACQVVPWFQMMAREIQSGRIPLWNPYEWLGHSMLGQMQPGLGFPLNWLVFLWPFRDGFLRFEALHWCFFAVHWLAACAFYWLCRDCGLSRAASILGGLLFALGGYMGGTDWPAMLNGGLLAPAVLLFLLRSIRQDSPARHGALAGAALGFSFLSGHHQAPFLVGLAAAGIWLYALGRAGRRLVPAAAAFGAMALLSGALQILPGIEYGRLAVRWVGTAQPVRWAEAVPYTVHEKYAMAPSSLLGILFPNLSPHAAVYFGFVAVTLAGAGLYSAWKEREVRIAAALALGGLLFALGPYSLFHGLLYALLPGVDKARNPAAAAVVFSLGVALLAAYGLDTGREAARRAAWPLCALAAALGLVLLVLKLLGRAPSPPEFALAPLVALLLAAALWSRAPAVVFAGLALFELALGGSASRFRPVDTGWPFLAHLHRNHDVAQFLKSRTEPGRFDADRDLVPHNFGDWHGLHEFDPYTASLPVNVERFQGDRRARVVFGVRYHLGAKPAREGQTLVFTGESGLLVFEDRDAFPRLWTAHAARRVEGPAEASLAFNLPFDELRRTAILSAPPPDLENCPGEDRTEWRRREPNRLVVNVTMACRGMLIVGDAYYPGWEAQIDGRPARIFEAYGALRAVVVEAGTHQVEMTYRPLPVKLGAAGTAAGLLLCLFLLRYKPVRV